MKIICFANRSMKYIRLHLWWWIWFREILPTSLRITWLPLSIPLLMLGNFITDEMNLIKCCSAFQDKLLTKLSKMKGIIEQAIRNGAIDKVLGEGEIAVISTVAGNCIVIHVVHFENSSEYIPLLPKPVRKVHQTPGFPEVQPVENAVLRIIQI